MMLRKLFILCVLVTGLIIFIVAIPNAKKDPAQGTVARSVVPFSGKTISTSLPTQSTSTDIRDTAFITEFIGYYSTYDVVTYPLDYNPDRDPKPETKTCPAFVVLNGDNELAKSYKNLIQIGNTVNHLDDKGQLILNIDTEELPLDQKNFLINSSPQSPVSLTVKNKVPGGKDAYYCHSFVNLISIK